MLYTKYYIPYYTILYYTILYYTILYYTIPILIGKKGKSLERAENCRTVTCLTVNHKI